jgi:integrase
MLKHSRSKRFQRGTLSLEARKLGPAVWVLRYYADDGTRPKVEVGNKEEFPTKAQAEKAVMRLLLSINSETPPTESVTMTALIERFIKEMLPIDQPLTERNGALHDENRISTHSAKCYKSLLNCWIKPKWAEVEINGRITKRYLVKDFEERAMSAAIEKWLHSLMKSRTNPKGLAPLSVHHVYNAMRQLFRYAVKWGYIERNPVGGSKKEGTNMIDLPRGISKPIREKIDLSPQGFLMLLKLLGVRERAAVALAAWLGPRRSEEFGLKWRNFNFEKRTVRFEHGIVQGRITNLKNDASREELPLPEEVIEPLLLWRRVTPYREDGDWVFASEYTNGKRPYWPDTMMRQRIRPIAMRAGLGAIGWHSFRHSYSSWGKAVLGDNMVQLKDLMRHEDIATTANIYGVTPMEVKRAANAKIIEFVKSQDGPLIQ